MPKHVVAQGECLTSIASRYGFADPLKIYNDPANATLKRKRPNPNLLFPGDEISIPEVAAKPHSSATGSAHKFVVKVPQRTLKIRFVDASDQPLKSLPYTLTYGSEEIEGKLDGDGVLEKKVPASLRSATLEVGGMVHELEIGALNPMKDTPDGGVSGVQARLANLGYGAGAADGVLSTETQEAISRFQSDCGLEPTGQIDGQLIDALEKAYGC